MRISDRFGDAHFLFSVINVKGDNRADLAAVFDIGACKHHAVL